MLFFYSKYKESCGCSRRGKKRFFKLSYRNSRCETQRSGFAMYSICKIYSICKKKIYHGQLSIELPRK